MAKKIKSGIFAVFVVLLPAYRAQLAYGEDMLPDIHGQAMQSFIATSAHEYIVKNSSDGSFQWTEFLINASKDFGKARVGGQYIARSLGDDGHFKTNLDWGFVDYRAADEIGIRAGKIKAPLGLHNESRDLDSARNSILLDQAIYPEPYRAIENAYQGIGVYGTVGQMQYHAFYGTADLDTDFFQNAPFQQNFRSPLSRLEVRDLWGAQIIWNTSLAGLRTALSGYRANTFTDINGEVPVPQVPGMYAPIEGRIDLPLDKYVFSVEYVFERYAITSEVMYRNLNYKARTNLPLPDLSAEWWAWYIQGSAEVYDRLFGEAGYHQAWDAEQNMPMISNHQNTVSLALRYDIMPELITKLQYDFNAGSLFTLDQSNDHKGWGAMMARISCTF